MASASSGLSEISMARDVRAEDGPTLAELVEMAVHDMKSPLSALRHALQVLHGGRVGVLTDSQARFITMALDNASVLVSLMDGLRGTASGRSSAGAMRPENFDLGSAASFVVRSLQGCAEAKGVDLQARVAKGLDEAWGDPVLLRRILINLVTNALKYASAGGSVQVLVDASSEDPALLVMRVRDRGPGIPQDDLEAIFERGARHAATCGNEEGAGLGLSIVRDIARAHGGRCWASNNAGRGCTFHVSLPAFGGGRGAAAQLRCMAPAVGEEVELVALRTRTAALPHLASRLGELAPDAWRLLDLGRGWLGILRPAGMGRAGRPAPDVLALLGTHASLVDRVGRAACASETMEPHQLIESATASPIEPEPTVDAAELREAD